MRKYLALFCLVLLACSGGEGPDANATQAFIGGTEALQLHLIEGSPPETVQDSGQTKFATSVVLENVGESDVGNQTQNPFVVARLTGLNLQDPSLFNLGRDDLAQRLDQRLRGARKNFDGTILPGELATLTFANMSYRQNVVGSQVFRLQAEACYDYATRANMKICLKQEHVDTAEDASLCNVRDDLQPRTSGGPLQVVRADQRPAGEEAIRIEFFVQNLGNGDFYSRAEDDPLQACGAKHRREHRNEALIVVEPVNVDAYKLDCQRLNDEREGYEKVSVPSGAEYGTVRFHRAAPYSVTCMLRKEGEMQQRVVQDLLNVHVYYRYWEAIEVPIVVQDESGYVTGADASEN